MKKIILILAFAFLLFGCRAKKIDKVFEEVKIEKTSKEDVKEKKVVKKHVENDKKIVKENNVVESKKELNLNPIDKTKPIDIIDSDGKKTSVWNASINVGESKKTDNTKTQTHDKGKTNLDINKEKEAKKLDEEKSDNSISTIHKDIGTNWILIGCSLFFLIILILIIRWAWKKRKNLPYVGTFFRE